MRRRTFVKMAATGIAAAMLPKKLTAFSMDPEKILRISRTTPTLQVVVNPMLRRGSKVHDNAFKALHELGADYVRYVPWLPYPRLAVAELEPPSHGETHWDFSLIDPMTVDFLEATKGHPVILNFSVIPEWMFKTEKPVTYPNDPDQVDWDYQQGTELKDDDLRQVADYYARLLSWYTQGGFTDELGKYHESGYHYSIPYWEVLNEVEYEHNMSPQTYTRFYDAIVGAMKKVSPELRFAGPALASPGRDPKYFEYFLNHDNHKPGIPIDFVTYHFYAVPGENEPEDSWQYSTFDKADGFLDVVRFVEDIRKRLSPETKTDIDEIGTITSRRPIPDFYWNLSGAMYAYLFGNLSEIGVDVAGESQLVGYPTQYPSVSMVNWETGRPNARYQVLKLIRDHFGPGDKIISSRSASDVYSYSVIGKDGTRRMMLVNKRSTAGNAKLPAPGKKMEYVDQRNNKVNSAALNREDKINLGGYAVAVVTFQE